MGLRRGWDVAAGLLIMLGLMQLPGDMILGGVWGTAVSLGRLGRLAAVVDMLPALPLVLALAGLAGWQPGLRNVVGFIAATALPALILTFWAAYDAGGGAWIIVAEGGALTTALWGMLLRLTGRDGLMLAVAVLAALWSLAMPIAVARSAQDVAGRVAFCIARHEPDRPVRSWAELRGVSFHTDKSGYKDTSHWFLHGVMVVQRATGPEIWNWSPRRLRFDRIARPQDMIQSPFGTCTPKADFMAGLAPW